MTDATPDRSAPETVPVVEKVRDEACDDLVATVRDALAELTYMSRHAYRVGGHRDLRPTMRDYRRVLDSQYRRWSTAWHADTLAGLGGGDQ